MSSINIHKWKIVQIIKQNMSNRKDYKRYYHLNVQLKFSEI